MTVKQRLDQLLFDRGLAPSREKAKALIMAGVVLVNDRPETKAGTPVDVAATIRLKDEGSRYVSRGGDKLAGALAAFALPIEGGRFLDVGQSTGGFTDLLLERGAAHVTGVDVGYGQLAMKLRRDERVTCIERWNARDLPADRFDGLLFDGAVIDVSFISLALILPSVAPHVRPGGFVLALVKPQFEAGRAQIGKGGVVKDPAIIAACVTRIAELAGPLGLTAKGNVPSPLTGPKGNQEMFLLLEKPGP